jgi:hypothetical protein
MVTNDEIHIPVEVGFVFHENKGIGLTKINTSGDRGFSPGP